MDFKSYDLIVRYTGCSGERLEKKWSSIKSFYNDINSVEHEKLFGVPMTINSDVEAVLFGHNGDTKHFKTIDEFIQFCKKALFVK